MSDGFSSVVGGYGPSVFDCPKCKQTIDASATSCRFCGAPVDRDIALKSAALLAKVNQAISEANYMRTVALSLPVFYVLHLIPFANMLGELGFLIVTVVVPIWGVIWWIRYNAIEYEDAEFKKSRRAVLRTTIVIAAVFLISVVLSFIVGFAIGLSRASHQYGPHASFHGSRYGLESSAVASGSFKICSFFTSQRSLRPTSMEISPR
jgi:hypothetical protein